MYGNRLLADGSPLQHELFDGGDILLKRNDETVRTYVDRVMDTLLKDKSKRSELLYLIGRAEDADLVTWAASLAYFLQNYEPDASEQRSDESDEVFVGRLVKSLISGAEPNSATELEFLLTDMESYRGDKKLFAAIKAASMARRS
jgi:hypothetical protein